ncbi:gluconokinase [Actinomadura atramentaria]|uniref:gluconokinase n=1 Tax=Actinomadura atramentaria TaxID=1990 RepID=UPI0003A6D227|nr:gluconokinase [Actinomadura atramentaria]
MTRNNPHNPETPAPGTGEGAPDATADSGAGGPDAVAEAAARGTDHAAAADLPPVILVMGVAGSGKSTIGRILARRLGRDYEEGDDFHSPENVAKMADGTPLTDEDRRPWLREIAAWLRDRVESGHPVVISCSALKRSYREMLGAGEDMLIVYLDGAQATIEARMRSRMGHFFQAELLNSQFHDLEPPGPDEALVVSIEGTPSEIAERIVTALR